MRAGLLVASLGLMGVLTGCVSSGPGAHHTSPSSRAPSADIAIGAGVPAEEAHAARQLYVLKCAKCHRFYDPAQYSDAEWKDWMTKMSRKARLTAVQEASLGRYLQAFRNRSN